MLVINKYYGNTWTKLGNRRTTNSEKMKKILIRADGNSQIGLGHVMRTLALVDILMDEFNCYYAIVNPQYFLKEKILKYCKGIYELPETNNLYREAEYLTGLIDRDTIVLLDGYNFDTKYQQIIKNKGHKLVCIDDLHQYHFVADAIINRSFGCRKEYYSSEPYTRFYLGPAYSLLKKEFTFPRLKNELKSNSVFVCFGGADENNCTLKTIRALEQESMVSSMFVVTGGAYQHMHTLENYVSRFCKTERIVLYSNIEAEELAMIMRQCEYAVVPASSILYEAMAVGLKIISGYTVDNQYENYKYLEKNKHIVGLGNFNEIKEEKIRQGVMKFLNIEKNIVPIDRRLFENTEELYKQIFKKLLC